MVDKGDDQVVLKWDSFLPRGSLRVLLVEGDDSTRQIISALLRKCNYKVTAVSDGMEGWKILKEKPDSIDLVLSEVEVPSVSGLELLTSIMDHESCKKIPVIMMSSHDSMNMVYKCMLKGAAGFLMKPVRKNELRNLWQHVWRKHYLTDSHPGKSVDEDGNIAKKRREDVSDTENRSGGHVQSMKKDTQCSEKKSDDAESSCTRSDMEADSAYRRIRKESQNGERQTPQNNSLLVHEDQIQGKPKPLNGKCMSSKLFVEEERSFALVEVMDEDVKPAESVANDNTVEDQKRDPDAPSREAINLIGAMEYQADNVHEKKDSSTSKRMKSDDMEILYEKNESCKSSSMPLLELSLRREHEGERGDCCPLNHSGSSAFSQYNSRPAVATTSKPMTSPNNVEEGSSNTLRLIPDQGSGNFTSASRSYGPMLNMNIQGAAFPTQERKAIKCSPLRVIPLPIPFGGMKFDTSSSGYGQLMLPMFYPQQVTATTTLWNNTPTESREVINKKASDQPALNDVSNNFQSVNDQSPISPSHQVPGQIQATDLEPVGNNGSSTLCNKAANHLNNVGENMCATNSGANSHDEKKLMEIYRSSQREAALNKFRMKRKERCFEKKVRYQSRQKLAEQRPRVKGQFVRHVQSDPPPTEA